MAGAHKWEEVDRSTGKNSKENNIIQCLWRIEIVSQIARKMIEEIMNKVRVTY